MNGKRKYIMLVVGIISFGLLLVGGTYAYLTFSATVTNGSYNAGSRCFLVDYNITNDDNTLPISGVMFQSSTPKGGLSGKVTMKVNSTCNVNGKGTISLNVGSSTNSKLFENNALKYAVYEGSGTNPVSSGNITSTGNMNLYSGFSITSTSKSYNIYIWLDGNIADNEYANLSFNGYVFGSAVQSE